MIFRQLDNKFDCLGFGYGLLYPIIKGYGRKGQDKLRKTDEEDDKDSVEEEFHLTRVKFDSDGDRDKETLGTTN